MGIFPYYVMDLYMDIDSSFPESFYPLANSGIHPTPGLESQVY
jgi:hypothetical protein